MAEKSDVWKGPAVVWNTEKPTGNKNRWSSVFSVLGETWQLAIDLYCQAYRVHLNRVGDIKPKTQFSVITSVQSTESVNRSMVYRSHGRKANVTQSFTLLWGCKVSNVSEEITGFKDSAYVTVICMFTDIPVAMPGIFNETVEVTTQTDFHHPLPVKNLHHVKLSSDANLDCLSRDLCKLLDDKVLPDINLRCGDRTVAAHKLILAARSPVFSAMFQSQMLESETGMVDITDVDVDVLEMFLKYVYSGRLSDLSQEGLPSLYAAGDKYDVRALKKECSERMINNLSRENCLNVLLLADAHSDQDLKNVILDFILNQVEILKSQEWMKLCKENPALSTEVLQSVLQRKLF